MIDDYYEILEALLAHEAFRIDKEQQPHLSPEQYIASVLDELFPPDAMTPELQQARYQKHLLMARQLSTADIYRDRGFLMVQTDRFPEDAPLPCPQQALACKKIFAGLVGDADAYRWRYLVMDEGEQ